MYSISLAREGYKSSRAGEFVQPGAGTRETDVTYGLLFWQKCAGFLDGFVAENEEAPLEIAEPVLIKVRYPSLKIRKKIDPLVNIKAIRKTALSISSDEEEEEALVPKKRAPPETKEKRLKTSSLVA